MQQLIQNFPLQAISLPMFAATMPIVYARLDKLCIDNINAVGGNKICKLLPNLEKARTEGYSKIISFGGAWSNHLHALAAAGKYYDIQTIGVVRGERPLKFNAMLTDAQCNKMQLHFVSRKNFKELQQPQARQKLRSLFGCGWVVPVGGSNYHGILGIREMASQLLRRLPEDTSELWMATATGGTLLGIALALQDLPFDHPLKAMRIKAVLALKNASFTAELERLLINLNKHAKKKYSLEAVMKNIDIVRLENSAGYASITKALHDFHCLLERQLPEPIDHVYMLKVFYALHQRLESTRLSGKLAVLHTGGQQGRRGL